MKRRLYSIAIIGPPASGKGTISKWLCRDFDALHISTGDLLRQNSSALLQLSESAQVLENGHLADDSTILNLLNQSIKSSGSSRNICFDGFPRRKSQAEALDSLLLHSRKLEAVLLLDISEEVLLERITGRWIHEPSGRVYSYSFSPPKHNGLDDLTGEALIQRPDDSISLFKVRLQNYYQHLHHITQFYASKGILHRFSGRNSSLIYRDILDKFKWTEKDEKMVLNAI